MRQVLDWARGLSLNGVLATRLAEDGIRIVSTPNRLLQLQQIRELQPDAILLDVADDVRVTAQACAEIRRETNAGLIVLAPTYSEYHDVELLDAGADDYVVFRSNYHELAARIRALLRRAARVSGQRVYAVGDMVIDAERRIVTVGGRDVTLTPLEFRLLVCLAANSGRSLSPGTLIRAVQGYSTGEQEATQIIKALVWRLRKKIEQDPSRPQYIRNVRGSGYMLDRRKPLGIASSRFADSLSA